MRRILRNWRWAAVPFGVVYLVLLALRFRGIVATANLDADAVSAPVIAQLFGSAPASAHVVLGEFGWYATLLFLLGTKWLAAHRQVWELLPYAMALAGAGLTTWSVWRVAGLFAASLTAVLLVCLAPATLHLLLSMTQHAPDWFCLALLAAFLVLIQQSADRLGWAVLAPLAIVVGLIAGINAASDPLLVICGLVPFVLALIAARLLANAPGAPRAILAAALALLVTALAWAGTAIAMSALHVAPERGLHTTALADPGKIGSNFKLWWHSVAVLANGDFFGRPVSFTAGLAVLCAVVSLLAVGLVPGIAWVETRQPHRARERSGGSGAAPRAGEATRVAFFVFWCFSAMALTVAFLLSAAPVDIHADRYLVGVLYAAAAVVPAAASRRVPTQAAALVGTCVIALAGVIALAQGRMDRNTEGFPPARLAGRVAALAAAHHLKVGYAGYWDAAPVTWASRFRVHVYPVSVCDGGAHLCPFDLHVISSWYTPHRGVGSFLLSDRRLGLIPSPTPDLGRPAAVYRIGQLTMYVYRYDIAGRFALT